jgi:hypothetical protein
MFKKFYGHKIRVYDGESNCSMCGKKHKHIFEIDGEKYGIECAKKRLDINLKAPSWLYELANNYIEDELKDYPQRLEEPDRPNFEMGFWELGDGISWSGDPSEYALWSKTVTFFGKKVNVSAQYEINAYLDYAFDNY